MSMCSSRQETATVQDVFAGPLVSDGKRRIALTQRIVDMRRDGPSDVSLVLHARLQVSDLSNHASNLSAKRSVGDGKETAGTHLAPLQQDPRTPHPFLSRLFLEPFHQPPERLPFLSDPHRPARGDAGYLLKHELEGVLFRARLEVVFPAEREGVGFRDESGRGIGLMLAFSREQGEREW